MQYLAKSFLKKTNFKKEISKFEVHFYTNGKHTKDDICIDLMPHALSLILEICKKLKIKFNKVLSNKVYIKKYSWRCTSKINNINCVFNFKQNCKLKRSKFFFKINNQLIDRKTKIINNKFENFLKYNKKVFKIRNPMKNLIFNTVKKNNNYSDIKKNNEMTMKIMKINYDLLYEKF